MATSAINIDGHVPADLKDRRKAAKRVRQRRPTYFAQAVSYSVDAAILALYYVASVTSATTSLVYLAAGLGWAAFTLFLSETHFNDHFEDHYLTVPQSVGSTSILLGAIYLAPEVGFYFVSVLFIVLGFGALRMSPRQTALVWTYGAVGLTYLFAVSGKPIAMPMDNTIQRDLALLCFVSALGRSAFTGLYGSSLREMLYRRGNELKEAHARIEELAQIDELTGVLNRRYIMKALNEEMSRAQRSGSACSMAIIDLDLFKRVNDSHGHPIGDEVLKMFAIAVGANIRDVDKFGRYGGEEFLLVLPGNTTDQALIAVDRIRQVVADLNWRAISADLAVTMSAGVSEVRTSEEPDDVLARADAALYRAKNAGRNQVLGC